MNKIKPLHRILILGAGKGFGHKLPAALVEAGSHRRVLDWQIEAFSLLPNAQVEFLAGFEANRIAKQYPQLSLKINPEWTTTGSLRTLSYATLGSERSTFICYSDIVFRPIIIERLNTSSADVVLAIDSNWQNRYENRTTRDKEQAEKVQLLDRKITRIDKRIYSKELIAEFVGLVKLGPKAQRLAQTLLEIETFTSSAGITELLSHLLDQGLTFDYVDVAGDWAELNAPQDLARFVLGTKAESLQRLKPLLRKSKIAPLRSFSLSQWRKHREQLLKELRRAFEGKPVIVRSSAEGEDSWANSQAGENLSLPNIPSYDSHTLATAIDDVFSSYKKPTENSQVLVQSMLNNVSMSGVVLTRTPQTGSPYYVINYDCFSKRTDTVTSGSGKHIQTLYVHKNQVIAEGLDPKLEQLIQVIREIETLVGYDSLDIEFAFTDQPYVLQVRPIAISHPEKTPTDSTVTEELSKAAKEFQSLQLPSPFIVGDTTQLSVMTDWNPAEMIGTKPRPLALSLYRYLITDEIWATQRAEYGYRDVRPANLILDILGHPYVDVRTTFNSFIPAKLSNEFATRLTNYYIQKLALNPNLHDKVEFEILHTCYTFDFEQQAKSLLHAGFTTTEITQLRDQLWEITRSGLLRSRKELKSIAELDRRRHLIEQSSKSELEKAYLWLQDIRIYGTLSFSHLARNAFVSMNLLRSLERMKISSKKNTEAFLGSLSTVSTELLQDAFLTKSGQLSFSDFRKKYGHLRPGTYDIQSPCYAADESKYLKPIVENATPIQKVTETLPWNRAVQRTIQRTLKKAGFRFGARTFVRLIREAIEGREKAKFVFTRNLSLALESIAKFGSQHGLTRHELSFLTIDSLMQLKEFSSADALSHLNLWIGEGKRKHHLTQALALPNQICRADDFFFFKQSPAQPNYVTSKVVRGTVYPLLDDTTAPEQLEGKIVMIPSADPGYDWIFSSNLSGLLTMYGGTNSHMAIRAAEFGLPAAVGIGELLFNQIATADMIVLDCSSKRIEIISQQAKTSSSTKDTIDELPTNRL